MGYKITLEARMTPGVEDVDVPEDVAADLKATYEALRETPRVLAHGVYDTVAEKETFIVQAKSWARKNGLEFRVSPMKKGKFPANELRFNIRAPETATVEGGPTQAEEPRHAGNN